LAQNAGLRIQICGRVVIEHAGRRVESSLPGLQGRRLFAFLVSARSRVVPRDEAVDAVWPSGAPAACSSALNALISRIRPLVAPGRLHGGAGIRVELPGGTLVDLETAHESIHRAESALALGEWSRAWAASQAAMFTARRGFLPGEQGDWIEAMRRELEELHLRALEAYGVSSLRIGGTELPAAERAGRELVRLQPYRESGHRHLMATLAAQSNTAEALRVYEELRSRLRDELGIAPSAATRELHERLLSGAPAP
jgi:SARP family transcriptional regulator, regulator of embCAB operon